MAKNQLSSKQKRALKAIKDFGWDATQSKDGAVVLGKFRSWREVYKFATGIKEGKFFPGKKYLKHFDHRTNRAKTREMLDKDLHEDVDYKTPAHKENRWRWD